MATQMAAQMESEGMELPMVQQEKGYLRELRETGVLTVKVLRMEQRVMELQAMVSPMGRLKTALQMESAGTVQ